MLIIDVDTADTLVLLLNNSLLLSERERYRDKNSSRSTPLLVMVLSSFFFCDLLLQGSRHVILVILQVLQLATVGGEGRDDATLRRIQVEVEAEEEAETETVGGKEEIEEIEDRGTMMTMVTTSWVMVTTGASVREAPQQQLERWIQMEMEIEITSSA